MIEAALEPVRDELTPQAFEILSRALALIIGTEGMIVIKDVLQLEDGDARRVKHWAIAELIEAAKFYETRAAGLGADFVLQVERTLAGIVKNPKAGSILTRAIRRRLIPRFPFALLCQSEAQQLTGIALMHLRRRPSYWKRRIKSVR